jgi:hypothetical protein
MGCFEQIWNPQIPGDSPMQESPVHTYNGFVLLLTQAFPVVFELAQSHLQLDQENAKWFETAHIGWRLFTITHNHHQRMNKGMIGDGHARKIGGRSSEQNSGGAGSASGQKSVTGNRMNKKLWRRVGLICMVLPVESLVLV